MGEWHPDILGDGFEQQTLPLGSDTEGEVVATLVRSRARPGARLFGGRRRGGAGGRGGRRCGAEHRCRAEGERERSVDRQPASVAHEEAEEIRF